MNPKNSLSTKFFIVIMVSICLLCACGPQTSSIYDDMSTGTKSACKKIVEYTDQYIELDLSYDDFDEKYEECAARIEKNTTADTLASASATNLHLTINQNHRGSATTDDIIEARDELAETVGIKPYKKK